MYKKPSGSRYNIESHYILISTIATNLAKHEEKKY